MLNWWQLDKNKSHPDKKDPSKTNYEYQPAVAYLTQIDANGDEKSWGTYHKASMKAEDGVSSIPCQVYYPKAYTGPKLEPGKMTVCSIQVKPSRSSGNVDGFQYTVTPHVEKSEKSEYKGKGGYKPNETEIRRSVAIKEADLMMINGKLNGKNYKAFLKSVEKYIETGEFIFDAW